MTTTYDPLLARDPLRLTRDRLLTRITAPASEPVTLQETKLYLRVDQDEEDTLIGDLIVAARMTAEGWLRRSLISQSWKLGYDDGVPENVWLPMGPVSSLTSLTIVNRDSSTQTIGASSYALNAAKNALMLDTVLIGFRIEIVYVAGYGTNPTDVPLPIKQGLLSHIAAMYENRGEVGQAALPEQTTQLYMPFREVRL